MAILNGFLSYEIILQSPFHKFFEAYNSMMGLSEARVTRTLSKKAIPIAEWYKTSIDATTDKTNPAWQNPDWYSKLEGTMSVVRVKRGELVRAIWTIDFEKPSSEIGDPTFIMDNCVAFFTNMDESLLE
ncbi:unnamed protein product [Microthlaspi erraticum]|uniref:Bet v I/Major latex protein domain-containing protein n=1 Tax=Microthlaspi erraticum TaxID=1685480 RepID=A0A6D2JGR7_9BRAS|nr:unnamed protein product [Microthlaspi erraticum]